MISTNSTSALKSLFPILNNRSVLSLVNITQSNNSMMTTSESLPDGIGTTGFLNKILKAAGHPQPQEVKNGSMFSSVLSSIRQYLLGDQEVDSTAVIPTPKEERNISITHIESKKENSTKDEVKIRVKRLYGNTKNAHTEEEISYSITLYNNGEAFCSGSILNHDTVLTAAHCVYQKEIVNMTVGIGSSYKSNQTHIPVVKTFIHPDYEERDLEFADDEDYADYIYDPNVTAPPINMTNFEFDDGSHSAEVYDLALVKVENGPFKKHDVSFVRLPRDDVIQGMRDICQHPKRLQKAKLWMAGSGKSNEFNSTDVPFTKMKSGFLRFSPKCIDNETMYVEYKNDEKDNTIWCSGDSGSGLFRVHPETGRAALVGVVRSSNALPGPCLTDPNLISVWGDVIEGRAAFLSKNMTEFMSPHLQGNKGLRRWEGYPKKDENKKEGSV